MSTEEASSLLPEKYLDVARLADGRFCVHFIKQGVVPRTSYTMRVGDVVNQALRAGHVPVRTHDEELRRACSDQQVEIIV